MSGGTYRATAGLGVGRLLKQGAPGMACTQVWWQLDDQGSLAVGALPLLRCSQGRLGFVGRSYWLVKRTERVWRDRWVFTSCS